MRLYLNAAFTLILSLFFISCSMSFASDPREWSPTWKLPPGKKPANIVDESITVPGEVKKSVLQSNFLWCLSPGDIQMWEWFHTCQCVEESVISGTL